MTMTDPPVAMLITHRVKDWETWKKAFDDHMPARKAAGCLGHHINRDVDDPKMVYIYCPATDAQKARAFVDSRDLPDLMQRAGVESPPTVVFMKPLTTEAVTDRKLAGIIIKHVVEDFDRWRAGYDAFDGYRRSHGIVGHAVNLDMHQENHVIVYHQAEDVATLRAFVASDELEETMKRAGVVSTPEIHFVEAVDWADY